MRAEVPFAVEIFLQKTPIGLHGYRFSVTQSNAGSLMIDKERWHNVCILCSSSGGGLPQYLTGVIRICSLSHSPYCSCIFCFLVASIRSTSTSKAFPFVSICLRTAGECILFSLSYRTATPCLWPSLTCCSLLSIARLFFACHLSRGKCCHKSIIVLLRVNSLRTAQAIVVLCDYGIRSRHWFPEQEAVYKRAC